MSSEYVRCEDTCAGKVNGIYEIAGVSGVYCEQGQALIQNSLTELCDIGGGDLPDISISGYGPIDSVTTEVCGFFTAEKVSKLAQFASRVRLVDQGRGEVVSNKKGAEALASGTNWHGGGVTWETLVGQPWCFEVGHCEPRAPRWPNMFHSCGKPDCVHWVVATMTHSRRSTRPITGSQTWLIMTPPTSSCPHSPPPPPPTPVVDCANTCAGKVNGIYEIAGVSGVYCEQGQALIQNSLTELCDIGGGDLPDISISGYGPIDSVTTEVCGFFTAEKVSKLAQFASRVRLVDQGRGEVVSNKKGAEALASGTNWHGGGVTWETLVGQPWCFEVGHCEPRAPRWPNMFHSCGKPDCVHWVVATMTHSRRSTRPITGSQTWLIMTPPTDCSLPKSLQIDSGTASNSSNSNGGGECTVLATSCVAFGLILGCALLLGIIGLAVFGFFRQKKKTPPQV